MKHYSPAALRSLALLSISSLTIEEVGEELRSRVVGHPAGARGPAEAKLAVARELGVHPAKLTAALRTGKGMEASAAKLGYRKITRFERTS